MEPTSSANDSNDRVQSAAPDRDDTGLGDGLTDISPGNGEEAVVKEEFKLSYSNWMLSKGLKRAETDICAVCSLPFEFPAARHSLLNVCCMTKICKGCCVAAHRRSAVDGCLSCGTPHPRDDASIVQMVWERVGKGDARAISYLATKYYHGSHGLAKDFPLAFELYKKAARLGSSEAHFCLGNFYYNGADDVEKREGNKVRGINHWQQAAMRGHVLSRHNLGVVEISNGNCKLAMQHFVISAKMGCEESLNAIKTMFKDGQVSEAQYAGVLTGYQDAMKEMKSPEREEAKQLGV